MKNSKIKKVILLTIITMLITLGITSTKVNAASLFLGLEAYRSSGYSYKSLDDKIMWKISVYNGLSGTAINKTRAIYCIKGGPGFGSAEDMGKNPQIKEYTRDFDLKNLSSIPSPYKDKIVTGQNYNSLIWVLEHCYVPAQNANENDAARDFRNKLLQSAGISGSKITDDEIDIVQQLAVWYFTNTDSYQVKNETFSLWIKQASDTDYSPIGDKLGDVGYDREDDAMELFSYFINNAKNAGAPTQNANVISVTQNNVTARLLGNNYVVGPYRINNTGATTDYDLSLSVIAANGSNISYSLLNSSRQPTSSSIKNLVGQDFYLSIPKTANISGAKIKITTGVYQTNIRYMSEEGATAAQQPVAEVTRAKNPYDIEINIVPLSEFDLALRKFITKINNVEVSPTRTPVVGEMSGTTAKKPHPKNPLTVKPGDIVLYTIRIYNEGNLNGYAKEITDYLPTGLRLKSGSTINTQNGWTNPSGDGKTIVTTKLASTLLNKANGSNIASADVQIECEVIAEDSTSETRLKNVAEITGHSDEQGNTNIVDRDSQPNNLTSDQKSNYNPGTSTQGWGYQDDDDFEDLVLPAKAYDFALRKFITKINNKPVTTSREPVIGAMTGTNGTTLVKTHTKTPLPVEKGDTVLYTIRVYNEGSLAGQVKEITDYLPAGLKLKEESTINTQNGWTSTDGKTIKTTKTAGTVLNAFTGSTPSSIDVQIECEVIEEYSTVDKTLRNIAEITKHGDKNGNESITDRDSSPNNLTAEQKSNYNPGTSEQGWGYQDDDDYEDLLLPARYYDFALRKFITKVNDQDVPTREPVIGEMTGQDGTTAVKTHTKKPVQVKNGDTVLYTIRVYNEGNLAGQVKEIIDYLPAGLKLKEGSTINTQNGWTNPSGDGKTIVTTKTAGIVLAERNGTTLASTDVQVECIVDVKDLTEKQTLKNIAEITKHGDKDGNENITDRDSNPNNLTPDQKSNYNPGTSEQGWGYQDDDDYEDLVVPAKHFDLALRKFITEVKGRELVEENGKYTREPDIDVTNLANGTSTTAEYKHQKDTVRVGTGDIVIYTIRVYNEGEIDGYANSVTDYLPPQLEFVMDDEEQFNAKYGWVIDSTLRVATTTYLSNERDAEENLMKAFDPETMEEPDYRDLKIKCRVKENVISKTKITNIAEITQYCDKYGNTNIIDRDSTANSLTNDNSKQADDIQNDNLPEDNDLPDYKGRDSNKSILTSKDYFYKGQQDDDDFEKLIFEEFDLALRKFITGVNDEKVTNRIPVFTTNKDKNGNYIYEHTKEPILVESEDIVEYTIRIFNEGDVSGYAKEIKDNIPEGLQFLPGNSLNKEYRWKMLDEAGNETTDVTKAKTIVTDYLSKDQEDETGRKNLINLFDTETMDSPDYKDVKVVFKVTAPYSYKGLITNIAEISDDEDETGKDIEDKDSTPDNDDPDEDDIDEEHLKLIYFDLALRKFITGVNDTEITNRIPVFKIDEDGNYIYEHTKEPVDVENGNIVTYTLRIFNEGTKAGYAKEVKDDLPDGLLFLPDHSTNKEYRWKMLDANGEETEKVEEAESIVTDYLSKEQEDETGRDNLLKVFDPETMEQPDYRDIKIAFKVTEPNTSDRILINKAQISDDSDEDGKDVVDKDSTPDKWIDGEDDQDIEKVKVKYFDLSLRKWVTQAIVIENGKETVTDTGHKAEDDPEAPVKVEIVASKINKVVVKFRYKIRITNEGEIAGSATEISDYIPQGLRFVAADNPKWKEVDGKIVTDQLKNTILQPGESAEVEVLLTWINGKDNMGLKTNIAEISKDWNDSDTPDIDSTPNNKKEGEDDIDDAPVILSVKTGGDSTLTYVGLVAGALVIIAAGVIVIKKYII